MSDAASSSADAAGADDSRVHPLEHRWTLYYNPPPVKGNTDWDSNVKKVNSFDTVEGFWSLFNALKAPSQLTVGSNYHLFKEDIEPKWEHKTNLRGGKWTVALKKSTGGDPAAAKQADDAWLYSLLALIGEQFGADSHDICGVVIAPRARETRLALWTATGEDEEMCKRIGAYFKQNIKYEQPITYQLHDESIKKGTSYRSEATYRL